MNQAIDIFTRLAGARPSGKTIRLALTLAPMLLLWLGCQRQEYSNRFTTPVKEITNRQIVLQGGRRQSIPQAGRSGATILVLVRHAEKAGAGDSPLTELGQRRARRLATILEKMDLQEVYASPYRRTEQTAQPVAQAHGLKVTPYDPSRLEDFLDLVLIRNKGQRVLIVGHSNTTPELLNLILGRKAYEQIADDDYDNLFVVAIDRKGKTSVFWLKFRAEE